MTRGRPDANAAMTAADPPNPFPPPAPDPAERRRPAARPARPRGAGGRSLSRRVSDPGWTPRLRRAGRGPGADGGLADGPRRPAGPQPARLFPAPRRPRRADRLPGRARARRRQLLHAARRRDPARPADLQPDGVVPDRRERASTTPRRCRASPPRPCSRTMPSCSPPTPTKTPEPWRTLWATRARPIEIRPVEPMTRSSRSGPSRSHTTGSAPPAPVAADPVLARCLLAYASDMTLLDTCLMPHAVSWADPKLQVASIDHALWFHGTPDLNDWLSVRAGQSARERRRGLNRGLIFAADGTLVASGDAGRADPLPRLRSLPCAVSPSILARPARPSRRRWG